MLYLKYNYSKKRYHSQEKNYYTLGDFNQKYNKVETRKKLRLPTSNNDKQENG